MYGTRNEIALKSPDGRSFFLQVIAQTADFVREAGGQSEFRLGVAQAGNPNFAFLRTEHRLFPYYRWLLQNPQSASTERSASLQGETHCQH